MGMLPTPDELDEQPRRIVLLDVFPASAVHEVGDGRFCDTVFVRQGLMSMSVFLTISATDLPHFIGRQLVAPVMAFLVDLIGHIHLMVPQKKVVWANALRVVAGVKDQLPVGYRTVFDLPRYAVGEAQFAPVSDASVGQKPRTFLTGAIAVRRPLPTLTRLIDLVPESIFNGCVSRVAGTFEAFLIALGHARLAAVRALLGGPVLKPTTASGTSRCDHVANVPWTPGRYKGA